MIFLDAETSTQILKAIETGEEQIHVSLDLGISVEEIQLSEYSFDVEDLRKISEDKDSIYFYRSDGIFKAALRSERFYKLLPTGHGKAPALLIDGVLMHRVKEIDPMQDARMKADLCARNGFVMLEICTGLGYSTIACLEKSIESISTIEIDPNVIELSRINPWSKYLFDDKRVNVKEGNAAEIIIEFSSNIFDSILHDPPRWPWGSELYTKEFYAQLYRVLKPGGILYHYVGTPGAKYRKQDIPKGVISRLRSIGFRSIKRVEDTLGIIARKP